MNLFELMATIKVDTKEYEKGLDESSQKTNKWSKGIGTATAAVAGAFAAVTGAAAATAGAILKITSAGAAYADDINTMATVTGLSTERLQEYRYMADLTDTSVETITGSLRKLTISMGNAAEGNEKATTAFEKLGVSIKDANGNMRDAESVFDDALLALSNMEEGVERDNIMIDLFGKSAAELKPLMAQGADGIEALREEAHKMGYVLDEDALAALNRAQDAMDRWKKATEAARNQLAVAFAPVLEKLAGVLTDLFSHIDWEALISHLQPLIDKLVDSAVRLIEQIDWEHVITIIVDAIVWIIDHAKMIMTFLGMLIPAIITLNVVMSANPIGIIILAIAALVAAIIAFVVFIKNHTEELKKIFDAIKTAFQAVVDFFKNAIDSIINFFVALGQGIKAVIDGIVSFFTNMAEGIRNIFDKIIGFASNLKDKITGFFKGIIDFLFGWPEQMYNIGKQLLEGLWNGIKDKIAWLKDKIKGLINTIKGWFTGKDGFDEHSPSKWAAKVFERVAEGGVVGLEDGEPDLIGAARSAISNFQNAFQPSSGPWVDGGVAVDVSTAAKENAGRTVQNDVQINVYAAEGQDAKAIADEIERRIVNKYSRLGVAFG